MQRSDWIEVLSRLSVGPVAEIDLGGTGAAPARGKAGADTGDAGDGAGAVPPPSARLWSIESDTEARFGVRVRAAGSDIRSDAARLAAAAIERGAAPVILSHVDRSGFEQLGFRVERVHGDSPAECAAQEAELCRFWDLAIVVDLEDVAQLS